jgi:hypothetical protein
MSSSFELLNSMDELRIGKYLGFVVAVRKPGVEEVVLSGLEYSSGREYESAFTT